jgi:hypothetical protein
VSFEQNQSDLCATSFDNPVELFCNAAYSGQWRIMDSLYENGWQQKPPISKEKIVNWAAGVGHINALECAWD